MLLEIPLGGPPLSPALLLLWLSSAFRSASASWRFCLNLYHTTAPAITAIMATRAITIPTIGPVPMPPFFFSFVVAAVLELDGGAVGVIKIVLTDPEPVSRDVMVVGVKVLDEVVSS